MPAPLVPPIRWRRLGVGVGLLLLCLQGNLSGDPHYGLWSQHIQAVCFGLGLLVSGAALSGTAPLAWAKALALRLGDWQHTPTARALLLILALAAGLRLFNLETGLHRLIDEIHVVEAVGELLYDAPKPLLLPHGGVTRFTWFFPYLQSGLVMVFGPSLSALRGVSVALGVAEVAAVYALVHLLFGRRTALLAALLLATFPPHIHFSRIGLHNIADPLFGLLAVIGLLLAMRQRTLSAAVLAGISLGLTHYFYEGGRLFFTPFVLGWLGWLALTFRAVPGGMRLSAPQLNRFVAAFVLTVAPLYYAWWLSGSAFAPRFTATGGGIGWLVAALNAPDPLAALWQRIQQPLLFYTYLPEGGSFYTGLRLLEYGSVPFFLLGWAYCIVRGRSLGGGLLAGWLLAAISAVSLLAGVPYSPRFLVVLPLLPAVIAIGLIACWECIQALLPTDWRRMRAAGALLPLLVGGGLALVQGSRYHAEIQPAYYQNQFYNEREGGIPVKDFDDMLFRLVALPPQTNAFVISPAIRGESGFVPMMRFYGRQVGRDLQLFPMLRDDFTAAYLAEQVNYSRTQAFFIEPEDATTLALLRYFFPQISGPHPSPYPIPPERQFMLYLVPPEASPPPLPDWGRAWDQRTQLTPR